MSHNRSLAAISLTELLAEADLLHFAGVFRNTLKIDAIEQLKLLGESDLQRVGMLSTERRRLRKAVDKHTTQSYLSKFVKILQTKSNGQLNGSAVDLSTRRNSAVDCWGPENMLKEKERRPVAAALNSFDGIIDQSSITFLDVISKKPGSSVHKALWNTSSVAIEVAVKKIPCGWSQREHDLHADIGVLRSLEHASLVRFYGAVLENESVIWLVTELAINRTLLECLRDPVLKPSLPVLVLCDMAMQICDGMVYLERRGLCHGNLSARNVLVFRELKVKVADVCLPRLGLAPAPHHKQVAWLAPEQLASVERNCSITADVWAFGVVLWEMFSFGAQPFAGFTDCQVEEVLGAPYFRRLEQPEWCPRDYYRLMIKCWSHSPSDRPTFHRLHSELADSKPEQLQVVTEETASSQSPNRKILQLSIGDVIVVLDNDPADGQGLWKGVAENRKAGLFNPSHTRTFLAADLMPSSSLATESRSSNIRSSLRSLGRPKLSRNMISRPQGDFRHVGHVGLDGATFGDVPILSNGFGSTASLSAQSSRTAYSGSRLPSESGVVSPDTGSSRSTPESQKPTSTTPVVGQNAALRDNRARFTMAAPSNGICSQARNGSAAVSRNGKTDDFHLDLGPSLMDEVFRAFETTAHQSAPRNCSSEVLSDRVPLTLNCSEPSTPSGPTSPRQVDCSSFPHRLIAQDTTLPPPKPTAPPRKKVAQIHPSSLDQTGVKPVSSKDEKVLDDFIVVNNQISVKKEPATEKSAFSPLLGSEASRKTRFSFRGFKSKISGGGSDLPPVSPRTQDRLISKPVELTDLITEESKEAYRALVEKNTVEPTGARVIPAPSPSVASAENVRDEDEESSPLKLLRRGAGSASVYKAAGNRPGKMSMGFARSVSHDPGSLNPDEGVRSGALSHSFRVPNGDGSGPEVRKVLSERPHDPPPLPPRDRSRPTDAVILKPRERKYPLVLPKSRDSTLHEGAGDEGVGRGVPSATPESPSKHRATREDQTHWLTQEERLGWQESKKKERECSF